MSVLHVEFVDVPFIQHKMVTQLSDPELTVQYKTHHVNDRLIGLEAIVRKRGHPHKGREGRVKYVNGNGTAQLEMRIISLGNSSLQEFDIDDLAFDA